MAKRHYDSPAPHWSWRSACRRRFATSISASVFQGVDFFAVILLAFLASTILFTAIPLLARPERVRKTPRSRPHGPDDKPHHRAGVVLLLLRAEPSRAVDRQHDAQRHGAAYGRHPGGVRRPSCQNRSCSDGGSTSAMPGSRCRSWRSPGSCCQVVSATCPGEQDHGAARPRGASRQRRFDHGEPALLQAAARSWRQRRGRDPRCAMYC